MGLTLLDKIKELDKKNISKSDDDYVNYLTGILPLDYANGFWQSIRDKDGVIKQVPSLGIMGGTFVTIIGATGTGKTTLAEQIAYSIIKPFDSGVIYHIDAEKTTLKERIIQTTGASYDDPRINLLKNNTSIEDAQEIINMICKAKESGKDQFRYEVEGKTFKNVSKVYLPSVMIIDSLPSFNSKEFNTDDLGTNTDQMRAAKDINRFLINNIDKCWEYNITVIFINHIKPKTDMNPYAAPPRGLMMLGQAEMLPRGNAPQYYSQTCIRINNRKSDAYTIEQNGFTGYKCTFQLAKSKTNAVGISFPVAFLSDKGFDPVYTVFEFADDIGLISGRNPYLYFEGLPEYKFNRKDFRNQFISSQEFREAVLLILKPYLEKMIGVKKSEEELNNETNYEYGDFIY